MTRPKRYVMITPYYKESRELIERCIASVKQQTIVTEHILVADGHPQDWIDGAGVRHFRLDKEHGDFGNTPRGVGALLAIAEQYDGIGLLDADNWLDPDHMQACLTAATSLSGDPLDCDYVVAKRRFRRPDGSVMKLSEEPDLVDTNCFFFLRGSFGVISHWATMPKILSKYCDRMFFNMIKRRPLRCAYTPLATVNYLTLWALYYWQLGETPPPNSKAPLDLLWAIDWQETLTPRENVIKNRLVGFDLKFERKVNI